MLVRTLYISRSNGPQTSTVTGSILKTSLVFNKVNGITGVLCQGTGFFYRYRKANAASSTNSTPAY